MRCFEVRGYVTERMKYKLDETAAQLKKNYTRHDLFTNFATLHQSLSQIRLLLQHSRACQFVFNNIRLAARALCVFLLTVSFPE